MAVGRGGREDGQRPLVTSLQLLALPSLAELRGLLQRLRGTGGPLEAVSEALCSARGPSVPGGLSLNWYKSSDLKEFVGQEPRPALQDSSLSKRLTSGSQGGKWGGAHGGRDSWRPRPRPRLR